MISKKGFVFLLIFLFIFPVFVSGEDSHPEQAIIPIPLTPEVDNMIKKITSDPVDKMYYQDILLNKSQYLNYFKEVFKIYDIPEELVYISVIESGLNPRARSSMQAYGIWQFMTPTARELGLRVNYWIDDRSDYTRSTHAAARYLKDLYILLGSWEHAIASYNAGSNRFRRALKKSKNPDDIQKLDIPRETKEFVLKFYAIVHIFENPEVYGFKSPSGKRAGWRYQELYCHSIIDLRFLSKVLDIPVSEIQELNPHLKYKFTPPHEFYLKVPNGKLTRFRNRLDSLEISDEFLNPDFSIIHMETVYQYYNVCPDRLKYICENVLMGRRFFRKDGFVIVPIIDYLPEPVLDELELNYNQIYDSGYKIIEIVEEKEHLEDFRNLLELFAN